MRSITLTVFALVLCINVKAQTNEMIGHPGPFFGLEVPGNKPVIFAKGIVSTDMYNHSSITVSPDGNSIYWAMAPLDTPRRIYVSKRTKNGWTRPEIVQFTKVYDGDCPVLSPDGKTMYFNSNRARFDGDSRRERIWTVKWQDGDWGQPEVLGDEVNGEHLHWQISVDENMNLYFGSERKGSAGKDDIFIARKTLDAYKAPLSMVAAINSAEHESTPFISPDGGYLIFHRDGLMISFKDVNGNWDNAVAMGDDLDGICPYVSPDGKYLFFLKMGMGYNDVYWVSADIIEELRSK